MTSRPAALINQRLKTWMTYPDIALAIFSKGILRFPTCTARESLSRALVSAVELYNYRVARTDDLIVLSKGEKVIPGPIEGVILASGLVGAAVMFGRQRSHVGLLVEPSAQHNLVLGGYLQKSYKDLLWRVIGSLSYL